MADGLDSIFSRTPPTELEKFISHPKRYIAEQLYRIRPNARASPSSNETSDQKIKVVCLSDTHNHRISDVPAGDILIHAGDLTNRGTIEELQQAIEWLDELPHKYKIVIAGNHELCLDAKGKHPDIPPSDIESIDWKSLICLNDSSVLVNIPGKKRAVKIYGNPWTPKQGNSAFQYPRHENFYENKIPLDVDILVTHGPPRHHLDNHAGCVSLLQEIWRVRPKLHVFGHIHAARGQTLLYYSSLQKYYELSCDRKGGLLEIFGLLWGFLVAYILSIVGWTHKNRNTILVNAAMVRGLKNEVTDLGVISCVVDLA
ncbi:hypothetical protein H072_7103 [Dactylellina haptotyla CBS 200.50]|uniref:Calcineurin-like phosphoesterase domain-containing protein n=1 Tax=Dactylellina haptotyla (strain CBS 200.50) TaxID=1284197 RepID=S8A7U9_DACHA|nr:hypothetical protein H072_7103 [Dactylellina haptotyla CBS 200.50]